MFKVAHQRIWKEVKEFHQAAVMKATSGQNGHDDPIFKLLLKGFFTVEGKPAVGDRPADPSDIRKYLAHRGDLNSPNAAFHDLDETYSRRAPKRTQKHYHRALHAHNDFAPVTGGHDHVRGMQTALSITQETL